MIIFTGHVVHASLFTWFDDTKSQTEFLNDSLYEPFLKEYDGNFIKSIFVQLGWLLIKGLFLLTDKIQNLIPDTLSLFSFVESSSLNSAYQSVVNTVVVGLMILSLVFIGYKLVTGRGQVDLKSVGMNVVMSVALILLMPTMISSGIQFAKTFYKDATTITKSDTGVAWSLIKDGVTDLAYINKSDQYQRIDDLTIKRNNLSRKNFYRTDFTQVLTDEVVDKLEKENQIADNLRYRLVPNSDNEFVATKFSDNFLATFSDGLKTGYYRYPTNIFGILCGLAALAIAYVFSAFVIITAILELAFKRVLGVLVFATDLESGQRSKVVLSDILQCYLTIGFQGFGLSMFGMFINYLNSGEGIATNFFIKIIAYICAVFVLIKGSGTVMRYFGVDIGLKEGYGQLASTLMLLRKGSNGFNRSKGSEKGTGSEGREGEERKPEKNFGETLSKKAQKTGKTFGYTRERGISGLANDGVSMASEKATRPFKDMRDMAKDTKNKFKDGVDDGTVSAINKNSKPISASEREKENGKYDSTMPTRLAERKDGAKVESADRVMSSSERMREAMKNNGEMVNNAISHTSAIQQKVQQDIEERKNAMHGQAKSAEEMINQKRHGAKYTPETLTREEMVRKRSEALKSPSSAEREALTKERIQEAKNSTGGLDKTIRENVQNTTNSQGSRTVNVNENLQSSGSNRMRTVDVWENLQNTTSSQGARTVDVKENVQNTTGSQGARTINVHENVQSSGEPKEKTQKINIVEDRKSAKDFGSTNETVIIDKEVHEKDKSPKRRFTYDDNEFFRDISNDPNPLFDSFLKK